VTATSPSVHDMAPKGMTKEEAKRCFYEPPGIPVSVGQVKDW
jgi:hypothetical protein